MLQALSELRPSDAVDILIAAAIVHAGIGWLRRSHAALAALGIALLGTFYLAARALELELTTRMLQGFFGAALVVVVVVFQDDLRRGLEELAARVLGRRRDARPRLDTGEVLVEALGNLARRKIGALVVVPGLQPLARQVHGGVELAGKLSTALLESIFDPGSPGHDGAAIVENRQVTHFGVQLPLSKSLEQLQGLGTRHSAALGLSERSDALCLVASEERGTLAYAAGGRLRQLRGPDELAGVLEGFFRSQQPHPRTRSLGARLLRENRGQKAAALALGMALWALFVPGSRPTQRTLRVPVELRGLPASAELVALEPREVTATLAGTRLDFLLLDRDQLRVQVDASRAAPGRRTLAIDERDLTLPPELRVEKILPASVRVSLRSPTRGP